MIPGNSPLILYNQNKRESKYFSYISTSSNDRKAFNHVTSKDLYHSIGIKSKEGNASGVISPRGFLELLMLSNSELCQQVSINYEYKIIIITHTKNYIHIYMILLGCITPKYRIPFFPFNHRRNI